MKWTRSHTRTTRSAKDRRNVRAPAIAALGRIVREHVKAAGNKIDELKFGDRPQAHQGRAASRADNRGFSDRRVDHTLWAKLIDDSIGDFEGAAIDADVFADQEHGWVALHLFPNALANSFHHRRQTSTRWPFELVFFFECGRHIWFTRLCRLMCGEVSAFRQVSTMIWGYAPNAGA